MQHVRLAVLDEVPVEALVWMHRADEVGWRLDLFEQVPSVWHDPELGLVEKYRTYETKRAGGSPCPYFSPSPGTMTLQVNRLKVGATELSTLFVPIAGEPPDVANRRPAACGNNADYSGRPALNRPAITRSRCAR